MGSANGVNTSRSRNPLAYIFATAVAMFIIFLVMRDAGQLKQLLNLSPSLILAIVILLLLPDRALVNHILLHKLGANVSVNESYGLSVITTIGNQLPFAGGIVFKGAFLKRKYDLAYTRYLSATAALFLFAISGAGLVGVAGSVYLQIWADSAVPPLFQVGFVVMAISPLLLLMPKMASLLPSRLRTHAVRLFDGMLLLAQEPVVPLKLTSLLAIGSVIFAVRLWLSYQLLSTEISLIYCIFFASATVLSQLVSIAPGGLGVREGIVAGMGLLIDVDPSISVVAVGIERLITIATIGVLAIYYAHFFGKNVNTSSPNLRGATNEE